ncbi:protein FAR1-RELATED SEQUENCE 5-like [Lactuca sativa]|uniref:protein FAR1-RELATED SEQUENCE 5-like n=1 Tax=Lactuca sativa TaxID=4236 RepID=UPI000CD8EA9E|nr:protein FAR1-RELATED SEQUENCE 5-like [Lactuca sativa]
MKKLMKILNILSHQITNYMDEDFEQSSHEIQNFSVSGDCSNSFNDGNSNSRTSSSCVSEFYMLEALHDIKPDVPEEFKPTKEMSFKDVDEGINFYKRYAKKVGFDVRLNTLRKVGDIIKHRFLVCNRMGKPKLNPTERNTIYRVTDCKAKIIVKRVKGTSECKFDKFQENHNHELEDTFHLKSTRTLSYSDKEFIVRESTAKVGAIKAYKLKSTLKGGFQYVRGKVVDYINFKRDMGSIIEFKDAQLIWFGPMKQIKHTTVNLEMLSLDATFRTNKYSLVFVPFTVINHHKSSVTVGVGLSSTEDVDSYKWLLEQFMKVHSNKQSLLVLTDQDATLKQAVESVFLNPSIDCACGIS